MGKFCRVDKIKVDGETSGGRCQGWWFIVVRLLAVDSDGRVSGVASRRRMGICQLRCFQIDFRVVVIFSSLAALGLIENNASNIVAAMLVSPLMGPVMSITFGAIISDRELIVSMKMLNKLSVNF
jgi:Domain of unknown function (DUF389)